MMTSFAFILGPGAAGDRRRAPAQLSRRAVGTPVFAGMLAASLVGIFMIPMLYVVFQWMRERVGGNTSKAPGPAMNPNSATLLCGIVGQILRRSIFCDLWFIPCLSG